MSEEQVKSKNEIKNYVSNTDKDIYTVSNIPEEVIAVIFAYVSRSPKGFRENIGTVIREEQLGQERAAKFHEKWVLNYGHASVAEHAAVHVGIEKVSRLFSSLLETSNEYLSFTEYSQRYQRPQKGDFYVPESLKNRTDLHSEYIELNNKIYDIYANLNSELFDYLKDIVPVPKGKDEKAHFRALEKLAFEDARYALNLATFTNLGMTGNARAIEDTLSNLLSSNYPEAVKRASEIKEEVRFSVPTLVKYANENKYIKETREDFENLIKINTNGAPGKSNINLINWTGKGFSNPIEIALDKIVNAILFQHSELSTASLLDVLKDYDDEKKLLLLRKSVEKLTKYDNPLNVFRLINYEAEFILSEACWHQLLRHRKVKWIIKEPGIKYGITIPPNIEAAGIQDRLLEATQMSESFYTKLAGENMKTEASYLVTNAHNRCVLGSFDLWELYHLINLRMSEAAQWDIKDVIGKLASEIKKIHPDLVEPALLRLN
jgi:thymidylate synthase ThyX